MAGGMPDGSQVEVAFDQGFVESGGLQEPICEVELELKIRSNRCSDTLSRQFCEQGGMRLGNLSKAAKGYRLAQGYQREMKSLLWH